MSQSRPSSTTRTERLGDAEIEEAARALGVEEHSVGEQVDVGPARAPGAGGLDGLEHLGEDGSAQGLAPVDEGNVVGRCKDLAERVEEPGEAGDAMSFAGLMASPLQITPFVSSPKFSGSWSRARRRPSRD